MNEAKLGDAPTLPTTGKRGRLVLAVAVSCLLHAAILSVTFGENNQQVRQFFLSTGTAPQVMSAKLLEAADNRKTIPLHNLSFASSIGSPQASAEKPAEKQAMPPVETAGILPLSGPVYYTSDQLTKRPTAVEVPELDTPATKQFIVSGKMILQLWIDERGKVVEVVVEESNLPEVFAETARNTFGHSRFTPGERDGVAVRSLMRIEVSYDDMRLPKP